jgi:colanic acid/amylovoran biosynthesis protein
VAAAVAKRFAKRAFIMSEKKKTVCLLGASLNTGNMGVSALASGTVTAALSCFPGGRVFLLDYGRKPESYTVQTPTGPTTVDLVNIRFSKKFWLPNNIARLLATAVCLRLVPQRWRRQWLARNPYLKAILEADVVASLAGGDSFSDIYGMGRLLYVSLPQILVLQLGKPLIMLPQTLGPFRGRCARGIAGYLMRGACAVYSRDKLSLLEAAPLMNGHTTKLRFSHDMAFVMEAVAPATNPLPARESGRPLVGVNVSGLLLIGGYTRNNMFGLKSDYRTLLQEIVRRMVLNHGADVVLVPHVFGDDAESDTQACGQMHQELAAEFPGRVHLVGGRFNQHEIKYLIGQCDFFMGARMHACIAALSQCVPAVCMAYSRKFAGVMESIGCAELVADLCRQDQAEVVAQIERLFRERERVQKALQEQVPQAKSGVRALFASQTLVGH